MSVKGLLTVLEEITGAQEHAPLAAFGKRITSELEGVEVVTDVDDEPWGLNDKEAEEETNEETDANSGTPS
jgi:hypothetical protein